MACTSCRRRTSSSSGVAVGLGPSSNVRYTVGMLRRGMRQTATPGCVQSRMKGNGAVYASVTAPTRATISHGTGLPALFAACKPSSAGRDELPQYRRAPDARPGMPAQQSGDCRSGPTPDTVRTGQHESLLRDHPRRHATGPGRWRRDRCCDRDGCRCGGRTASRSWNCRWVGWSHLRTFSTGRGWSGSSVWAIGLRSQSCSPVLRRAPNRVDREDPKARERQERDYYERLRRKFGVEP